jgi:broad specificity phosphatase PhoE
MAGSAQQVYVVRHGETAWSLSGQHTGVTDIPLTENGRAVARRLQPLLAKESFSLVLTSPRSRARETCELVGLGNRALVEPDLVEWNYGEYEGLTPKEIRAKRPGWMIFRDGCPDGETPEQVGARADRVIVRARGVPGNVALFAHGHIFRLFRVSCGSETQILQARGWGSRPADGGPGRLRWMASARRERPSPRRY